MISPERGGVRMAWECDGESVIIWFGRVGVVGWDGLVDVGVRGRQYSLAVVFYSMGKK
jgi:hypothetical protein